MDETKTKKKLLLCKKQLKDARRTSGGCDVLQEGGRVPQRILMYCRRYTDKVSDDTSCSVNVTTKPVKFNM